MANQTTPTETKTKCSGAIHDPGSIRPGEPLQYSVVDGQVIVHVHPGFRSLRGALASDKGKGMTWAEIREGAAQAHIAESGGKYE